VRGLKVEGDETGAATLKSGLSAITGPKETDAEDIPYTKLDSGVSYRVFREPLNSKEEAVVGKGTRVAVQMTGRLPATATKEAPGGLQFFNTKNTDIQELGWRIGESGNIVPGLEEGMMGMRKGELRRIIVPGERAYNTEYIQSRKFEPQPNTKDGPRYFDTTINNPRRDHTVVYEVQLERISDPTAKKRVEAPVEKEAVDEKLVFTPTADADAGAVAPAAVASPAADAVVVTPTVAPPVAPPAAVASGGDDISQLIDEKQAIDVPALVPQQPAVDLPPPEPEMPKIDLMKELAAL